jgi:hypothetical protein
MRRFARARRYNRSLSEILLNALFREFSQESLEADPAVCFVLDEKLQLTYCNPAWNRFALQNGATDLQSERVLGTPVLNCTSGAVLEYYRSLYQDVLAGAAPTAHDFHCSSPQVERLMRMQVYRLRSAPALLVVCSLLVERPHRWPAEDPVEAVYRSELGVVVMCSNCRRTRRAGVRPDTWDWVPGFLVEPPEAVSHGICNVCLEYYYPGRRASGLRRQ